MVAELSDYDLGLSEPRFGTKTRDERVSVFEEVVAELPEVRERLQPHEIARFLRSRLFNATESISMIRQHLGFVEKLGGYDPSKDWISLGQPATTSGNTRIGGFDEHGRLVVIKQMKYQYMPKREDGRQGEYSAWNIECEQALMMHANLSFYTPLEIFFEPKSMLLIVDFQGYRPWGQSNKKVTKELMKFCADNMPECIYKVLLMNPFRGLSSLSNLAKKFVNKDTAKKWYVCERPEEILNDVPKECVEQRYGGEHPDYKNIDDRQCDFEWLMQELYEQSRDPSVKEILGLLSKHKQKEGCYDLNALRKEAKEKDLFQKPFPKPVSV